MKSDLDRRAFLACTSCAALATACGDPAVVPFPTAETGVDPTGDTDSVAADEYPCSQVIDAPGPGWAALDCPELDQVGGSCIVGGIIVARVEEDCYAATTKACTHQGQQLKYDPTLKRFFCPLHGAVYDVRGDKVSGPQPRGVDHFPCGRVGDTVYLKANG